MTRKRKPTDHKYTYIIILEQAGFSSNLLDCQKIYNCNYMILLNESNWTILNFFGTLDTSPSSRHDSPVLDAVGCSFHRSATTAFGAVVSAALSAPLAAKSSPLGRGPPTILRFAAAPRFVDNRTARIAPPERPPPGSDHPRPVDQSAGIVASPSIAPAAGRRAVPSGLLFPCPFHRTTSPLRA